MNESSNFYLNESGPKYGSGVDLEFPDWSGHLPAVPRMPKDKWLTFCQSNLARLRTFPGYDQRRRENGIPVEFHL